VLHEIPARDHAVAVLDEIEEHVKHFGFQPQRFSVAAEFVEASIELPLAE
jgi:hypothetical protein